MKKIFLSGVLILILCSIAKADEISHRKAAEELLTIMGAEQIMGLSLNELRSIMEQQFNTMTIPEDKRPLLKKYTEKFQQFVGESVKNIIVSIFMETFTEDEIKVFSDVYKTEAGKAFTRIFIQKMPLLLKNSAEIKQKMIPDMMKGIQQIANDMAQEMKEAGEKHEGENEEQLSAGPYVGLPSAMQLNADIEKFGAGQVLWDRLWNSDKVFGQLMDKVSSGDAEWVALAVKLRAVSDAGATELLEMSMSRALATNPENVLFVLSSNKNPWTYQVEDICGGGMLYVSDTEKEIEKWRIEAISAVSGVNDAGLEEIKALCLKILSK